MRELKFRVWDKRNKSWDKYLLLNTTGKIVVVDDDYGAQANTADNQENYVIQQYTGLKDINGKEIYEGDIVKTVDGASDRTRHFASWGVEFAEYTHGEVKWLREGFEVCQEYIGATKLSVFSCDYFTSDLEIIGNISENPKLLKKNNI